MNNRIRIIIALLIIIGTSLFFLFKDGALKPLGSNNRLETGKYPIFKSAVVLPNNPERNNSNILTYVFTGQIAKINPFSTSSSEWILNISDSNAPNFIVNDNTPVFKQDNGNLTRTNLDIVQIGTNVSISMDYAINSQVWSLNTVTIVPLIR